jgi:hypothetical protein
MLHGPPWPAAAEGPPGALPDGGRTARPPSYQTPFAHPVTGEHLLQLIELDADQAKSLKRLWIGEE